MKDKKTYNTAKKANAYTRLSMRVLVAAYIIYMAVKMILGAMAGETTMPLWASWSFAIFFSVLAVLFIVFSLRRLKADIADAEIKPEESEQ